MMRQASHGEQVTPMGASAIHIRLPLPPLISPSALQHSQLAPAFHHGSLYRVEEVMVLQAIYGEQVTPMGASAIHIRLPLPPDIPVSLHAEDDSPQECLLEFT